MFRSPQLYRVNLLDDEQLVPPSDEENQVNHQNDRDDEHQMTDYMKAKVRFGQYLNEKIFPTYKLNHPAHEND